MRKRCDEDAVAGVPSKDWRRMLWLMPAGLAIHDAEELVTLPAWFNSHGEYLAQLTALGPFGRRAALFFTGAPLQLSVAVGLVVGLAFSFTGCAVWTARRSVWLTLYTILLGMAALHVLAHMGQAVYTGGYIPGLAGAVFCLLPASLAVYWHLLRKGLLTIRETVLTAFLGLVLFVPAILAAHTLAAWLCMQTP